jgi:hypothetical protein
MKVRVEIQRTTEAVLKDEQAALAAREADTERTTALEREHLFGEDARERAEGGSVPGEKETELEGCAENPLAHGHVGQHAVGNDEARVPHAARVA